ncbi:unnamed protein product (macronuclear) [Paramecium tetraurelia]|uniref:Protein kinase domain-containing protein n=1 Tax=Paramecium tetraurelia TaxID=5888 RepID=A0DR40_PARTE|nr:uncharacterized protein GSPATT00002908001 [Paramecium tetraurelia]CAK85507.1 unnamed protein product [Paramecium tetraurelia]|eukprot:XP_001452904.1 hypothetical protein (macronuclear) [Paramecium tetraurelia strain d4-2]
MGNQQQSESQSEFLEKKLDPNYGEISIYKNKANNLIFAEIKQVFLSDTSVESIKASLVKRLQLNHKCLVKILSFDSGNMDDFCSSYVVLTITVEYLNDTLHNDILLRKIHKTTYSEQELCYIIYEISNLCHYMKTMNNEIIDIYPSRILIDDQRQIKYFDQFLENSRLSNYYSVLFNQRDLEYVAPEQLILLTTRDKNDTTDQELVNIFCLGLMMVSLISGQRCVEFYNQEKLLFKKDYVDQLINKYCLRYQYSDFFKSTIQSMLKLHNDGRPNYQSLLQILHPHQDSFATFLNPIGKQREMLESQLHSFHTQGSPSKSRISGFDPVDFSEIDKRIKTARQKAQNTLDEIGLDLRLNNFATTQINIIEASE